MFARDETLAQFQKTRVDDQADSPELHFVSNFSSQFPPEKNFRVFPHHHHLFLGNVCLALFFGEAVGSWDRPSHRDTQGSRQSVGMKVPRQNQAD